MDDKPQMQHHLQLAREENILSNGRFNIFFRSFILNTFAIPKPRRSLKGTTIGNDGFNRFDPILGRQIK